MPLSSVLLGHLDFLLSFLFVFEIWLYYVAWAIFALKTNLLPQPPRFHSILYTSRTLDSKEFPATIDLVLCTSLETHNSISEREKNNVSYLPKSQPLDAILECNLFENEMTGKPV